MLFRPRFIAFFLLFALPSLGHAEEEVLPLKLDRTFKKLPANDQLPVAFISAQRVEARQDGQLEAEGAVELRQDDQIISADHLRYDQNSKDVLADGGVTVEQSGSFVRGQSLAINLNSRQGVMPLPEYQFEEHNSRGNAGSVRLAGNKFFVFEQASYTTCPAGNDDWLLKMNRLEIDRVAQVGTAYHTMIEFKGVPLLYTPWMDFPLNDGNRSGFLSPTPGSTNSGGAEITIPYYWSISPDLDATLAPRLISKRGTQFNNEVRYLQPNYGGEVHLDTLPNDRVSGKDRARYAWKHAQNLGNGFAAAFDANHVTDDDYFRDLSDSVTSTSQTNLLREGVLTYSGDGWNASARAQRYQTLQDPLSPVTVPYRRQPQLNLNAQQSLADGTLALGSEYVDFRHPTQVNGQRLVLYPSLSYPLLNAPGYFLTPKFGVHYTNYVLDGNNSTNLPNSSRSVPIFSLDGGLVFERNDSFLGNGYMQTLEPRAYYVRIPYRDQSQIANFDTAQAPFSFSQMFTENRFLGSDRVGDADMLTLALTSRVIDDEDGTERLRVGVAERFSFKAPQVNLVAPTESNSRSDILLTVGGRMTRAWRLDSLVQYNPNLVHTESYSAAARYNPAPGKLLNLGYRFTRNTLRQMDVSAQLPVSGRWHAVGRINYSLQDSRILDALGGLEYNEACWTTRLVAQSFATATQERTTGIFIQLELNDLVSIGSDPLTALRTSVSGYTKLNTLPAERPVQGLE
jgi:LPS-assembly protein